MYYIPTDQRRFVDSSNPEFYDSGTVSRAGTTVQGSGTTDTVYGGTVGDSGNVMLEGLIWGQKWDGSQPITYFFDDATSITNGALAWSAAEKAAYRAALQTWADVANITFTEVFSAGAANFVEQKHIAAAGSLGFHNVPSASNSAIGSYNQSGYGWDAAGLQPGGLGFSTLVHELGHALGLAHPHDTGGGSTIFPGVTTAFGDYGDNNLNQNIYTIMSYNHGNEVVQGGLVSFSYGDASTPMPLDIAAMQFIYGANTTTNAGSNTYVLPITNAAGTFWKGIYDTGGIDEIVHNGSTGATISLQSATVDNSATGGGSPSFVNGIRGGFTIAQSAVIENATGGFGADTIIGNSVSNNIQGRDGADTIVGSGGGDFLYGGIGDDTIHGNSTQGGVSGVGDGSGLVTTTPGTSTASAVDVTSTFSLASDANIQDSTTYKHTTGRYTTPASGALTAAYYAITVNAGTTIRLDVDATTGTLDTWIQLRNSAGTVLSENDQSAGTDAGSGGDVNDSELTFTVSTTGTYYLVVGEWDSALNAFKNSLPNGVSYDLHVSVVDPQAVGNFGTAGADYIDGGAGADTMFGGDGSDIYLVDNVGDTASETNAVQATGGYDVVIATANHTLGANIEQLVLQGAATTGTGNNTNNVLYGLESAISLTLNGLDGDDVIYGSTAGGNTLNGGGGVDTLLMYGGNNTASGGLGSDIYYTYAATDILSEAGGDGIDTVYATYSITVGEDIEQVLISGTATSITSNSLDDNNIFYGNSATGPVTLNGGGGADVLFGGSGADALNGGDGVDLLFGLGGADQLNGGNDTDIYYLTGGTEIVTEGGAGGFDTAYSNFAGTTTIGTNVEQLILYGAATGGTGNADANYLYGHIASNAVTLDGAGGADYLLDSAQSGDVLIGGSGNDQLDLRTGGNDFIRFAAGSNADVVFGFDADAAGGQDAIDVSGRGFSAGSIGGAIVISAAGADTLITIGADTIMLQAVSAASVAADDFLF